MSTKRLFSFFIALCFFQLAYSQQKKALIFAIANYPDFEKNGWPKLGSLYDVEMVQQSLKEQGFGGNIKVVADNAATKEGIRKALDEFINACNKGDIVVIHFSGHGAQLEDNDINEEPDLLDECIVPYGAVFSLNPKDYSRIEKGYFRDDELGNAIVRLRNKLGQTGNVLVILDACHSGSGTRDGAPGNIIRGPNDAMVSEGWEKRKLTGHADIGVINEHKYDTILSKDAATYVSISAAQANQPNSECFDDNGNSVGSLSLAFCRAMAQLKKGSTYRTLFSLIQNTMMQKVPAQTPVLEGDGVDKELFGSNYFEQKPFLRIDTLRSTPQILVLNGGGIWGVTKGSKIGFYEDQTLNPAGKTPMATGKVTEVSPYSCKVVPDKIDMDLVRNNPEAFIDELAWGDRKLKLAVLDDHGKQAGPAVIENFRTILSGFQLVEFNNSSYDAFIRPNPDQSTWSLYKRNSSDVFSAKVFTGNEKGVADFKELLRRFDRMEYLKGLKMDEPGISAKIELIFLQANNKDADVDTAMIRKRTINGRLELDSGDIVFIKVVNTGDRAVYFNILDLEPDGKINRLVPNKNLRNASGQNDPLLPQDCYLQKGDSGIIRAFRLRITPPYGNYTFKVFLSSQTFNLEDILATDDLNTERQTKGNFNNLEKVFVNSKVNTVGKRDIEIVSLSENQSGTIFNYNFILRDKKTP